MTSSSGMVMKFVSECDKRPRRTLSDVYEEAKV